MSEHRLKEPYQTIAWKVSQGWNEHLWMVPKELLEAYSDAIVKECISICEDMDGEEIKEHFGVE